MTATITVELLTAYRETDYHVGGSAAFVLNIDAYSPTLQRLHALHGVDCSAFLTAVNPHSQRLSKRLNTRRLQGLRTQLRAMHLSVLPGMGQHPSNGWPGEAGFLVLGLPQPDAQALGRQWGQNAIVFCDADAIARLVLLSCGKVS